jgi:hypothetical protein
MNQSLRQRDPRRLRILTALDMASRSSTAL